MMPRRRDALAALGGIAAASCLASSLDALTARGIIDIHAHVAVPAYLALLASSGIRAAGYTGSSVPGTTTSPTAGGASADTEAALAARFRMMSEAGVTLQILSPSMPPYLADEALAVRAAQIANDRHAELARSSGGRLRGFACLPLPHLPAALAEMRRGLDTLGLAGVSLHTVCLGTSIADERFAPLFAELDRRRSVLFVHPSVNGLFSPLINDWHLQAAVGPLLEDSIVALQLIAASIPVRYPEMRIVLPHLGGGLATMLDRLDNQLPLAVSGLQARPSDMARRFWYDTVSHGSAVALHAAIEAFGADRLVPGSDFPVLLAFESYARTFAYIRDAAGKLPSDMILHNNAPKLLRLG